MARILLEEKVESVSGGGGRTADFRGQFAHDSHAAALFSPPEAVIASRDVGGGGGGRESENIEQIDGAEGPMKEASARQTSAFSLAAAVYVGGGAGGRGDLALSA